MGVIALTLYTHHSIDHFYVPTWVKVAAGVAMGLGTYVGGWRIMRTLGQRVFSLEPASGFAAQTTAGLTIYLATRFGYPLSTTHVISGAVMGAGATKRLSAVRWGVAGNIVVAWLLTIPAAASSRRSSTGRCRRSSDAVLGHPAAGRVLRRCSRGRRERARGGARRRGALPRLPGGDDAGAGQGARARGRPDHRRADRA